MSRTKFYNSRKAISPVIATILLLAITVIIAVGVYQFLTQYSQDQLSQTQNNQILDDFNIRVIDSNAQESIIQTPFPELNVTRVLLDGTECEGNIGLVSGRPLRVNLSSCSQEITTNRPRLIIETEDGIIQRDLRSQDLGVSVGAGGGVTGGGVSGGSTFDCDDLPGSWIEVPGSSYFGTSDFCVMQFEAKALDTSSGNLVSDGGFSFSNNWADLNTIVARSEAASRPWVRINFTDALAACDNLNIDPSFEEFSSGENFRMITNRQWMTIARNIEANEDNWESGFGSRLNRGHSNNNPSGGLAASTNNLEGCFGYTDGRDCNNGEWHINKRTLTLSNGAVIWDLAGNVWQWVDLMQDGTTFNGAACGSNNEFTTCTWQNGYSKNSTVGSGSDLRFEMGPLGDFGSTNGVGRILSSTSTVGRVLRRGGYWNGGAFAGAFATRLGIEPGNPSSYFGFRCAFEP